MNPYEKNLVTSIKPITTAQEALHRALISLYAREPFYRISVKELSVKAAVARTTFYAYYQNTDELLVEIENTLVFNITEHCKHFMHNPCSCESDLLFFEDMLIYIRTNKDVLYTLLVSQPDLRFIEKWKNAIKYHFWERLFRERSAINSGLILEIVASEAIGAFTYWLENTEDVDVSNVNKIIIAQLHALDFIG